MATLRKFTKKIVIVANVIAVLIFLLACCNSFLNPAKWWLVSLLGLVFPLLFFIVFGFLVFWLFMTSRRWALISLTALILGWPNIHSLFAFHIGASFKNDKAEGALRVLTWNVHEWDEFIKAKPDTSHWEKMLLFLKQQDADLICFQEFFESHNPKKLPDNIIRIQKELNCPYYFFSHDYRHYSGMYETGVIIFSKYPISDTIQQKFQKVANIRATESLIAADVDVNGQTIRIFTTHLQSVLFRNKDYHNIDIIRNADDSMFQASKSIIKKLKRAYGFRAVQAESVRKAMDASPYPSIICGDFNDVPNSYTYSTIKANMQDAFIKKGFGIGRTYVNLSPTLRIDYIMASDNFKVLQCKNFKLPYSDHHPVIADIQLSETSK
ncbi:MAG TPA: endonuclease/exonuclease/phosphatase family protein [Puia sp.]|nr:endonuclease/exonuclease/phosphatase family protein [Puia sp.]